MQKQQSEICQIVMWKLCPFTEFMLRNKLNLTARQYLVLKQSDELATAD